MWITNSVLVQGREHIVENTPCQDSVYTIQKHGMAVIALADGAGSCPLSHFGAEISCQVAANFFVDYREELYTAKNLKEIKIQLYRALLTALEEKSQEHQCKSVKELSSTLLCVGIYKNKVFYVHIGDGVIVYRKDGILMTLSEPDNGEYANQTTFVTSGNALEHMRMQYAEIPSEIDAFFLMSDGSAASLYNIQEKRPSKSLNMFADMSKQYSQEIIHEELKDFFENSIRTRTLDDCSLCLLVQNKNDFGLSDKKRIKECKKIMELLTKSEKGSMPFYQLRKKLHVKKNNMHNIRKDVEHLSAKGRIRFENETLSLL